MNKITEPLKKYLRAHDCMFDFDRKKETVHFGIDGSNTRWRAMGCADDSSRFVLVSLIPLAAQLPRRKVCSEVITRINVRLGLGRFDLDFSDGELRYITQVPIGEKETLTAELIEHVIRGHHTVVDCFLPAIAAVLFAGIPPEKAIDLDAAKDAGTPEPRFSLN